MGYNYGRGYYLPALGLDSCCIHDQRRSALGITFMVGECIETVNHCITYELAVNKIYNSNLFLSAIQVTLELHDERLIIEAIKMWCCIKPQLKMDEKTQSRAREIWDKYFKSSGLHPRCPGCSWEGEDFVYHMRKTHMYIKAQAIDQQYPPFHLFS
jgi:hypothetical protein